MKHIISLVLLLTLTACTLPSGTTAGVNANTTNVTASIGYPVGSAIINPSNPSEWTAGIAVVFKDTPSQDTLAKMADAGAVIAFNDPKSFFIPKTRGSDIVGDKTTTAIAACLHGGARLKIM
jgi:tetrahydromethanopterin S-methyltransferase subunit H